MQFRIKQIKKEAPNTFSIILDKPEGFQFYPGQYLDVELPVDDPLGNTRIFSISSSPSEDFIMLTYNEGVTTFKKKLRELQPGRIVTTSHPAGTVVIDDSSPIVLMAGGIGIAPHRSMIKWAVDRKLNLPIILIYSNSDWDFIFKQELDLWQKQYHKLTIHYVVTSKVGHLDETKLKKLLSPVTYNLSPIFYLAGPPAMVDDFENILLKLGVDETSIRTDRFDGY